MNLLRYEFYIGPADSINGMLRTLVTDIRYNRSQVSIEDFKRDLPRLKQIESTLQRLDSQVGHPHRNYIQEIMDELTVEEENEENLLEDLERASVATINALFGTTFIYNDLSFSLEKADHFPYLTFKGYTDDRETDADLIIIREVFRSICYKYNFIFVDLS